MRPSGRPSGRRVWIVALLSLLLGVVVYAGIDLAQRAMRLSPEPASGPGGVPEQVYNAPDTVPTTDDFGPVGPVSMVYAGTDVLTGLGGELTDPWIAISSRTGDYRALDVPHRPEAAAGAMSVSPDGRTLAWGWPQGVVLYDAVEDTTREVTGAVSTDPLVGPFSPDGSMLVVHDGALRVLDVTTGEVLASAEGVSAESAHNAAWTPDGSAVSYVADNRLVRFDWQQQRQTSVELPMRLSSETQLAWQPAGERLAAMHDVGGVNVVDMLDVAADGGLQRSGTLRPSQRSVQRLLGFTSDTHLTVVGLGLETGALEQVYRLSAVDSTATPVMRLAGPGTNWWGSETVSFAAEPLAAGSADFEEPRWPWSIGAKLVVSALVVVFVVGLYLTRGLPRRRRRA
jgi:hypothetical protein